MAKKPKPKNKNPSKRWEKYTLEGDKVTRAKTCLKCGPAIFLGKHKDRLVCGKCGYMESTAKPKEAPAEAKVEAK